MTIWTASITRCWKSAWPEARAAAGRCIRPAALFALLAGCTPAPQDHGIDIEAVRAQALADGPALVVRQKIVLSREAREALQHGVPLVFELEGRLREPGARSEAARVLRRFEIHYLPLSDHYRVVADDGLRLGTYPRLRHALAGLNEIALPLPQAASAQTGWDARVRCRLLERALPRPMRLPAWLSPGWRHDSGWQEASLTWRQPA